MQDDDFTLGLLDLVGEVLELNAQIDGDEVHVGRDRRAGPERS